MNRIVAAAAVLLSAVAFAGCGDDGVEGLRDAQDRVDQVQENVDRVQDAVQDPVGAAREEAERAIEEALTPELEGEGDEE
jgi:hypothetical protein